MSARTMRALWCIVPFALVVAVVAFALVGAPGIDHGLATTKVPTHPGPTRREWVDIAIGALFAILAVAVALRLVIARRAGAAARDAATRGPATHPATRAAPATREAPAREAAPER